MGWFSWRQKGKNYESFRPRVGMGWFAFIWWKCYEFRIFVPEWGWVGSGLTSVTAALIKVFSSPSGDGLVRSITQTVSVTALYFRPRLGMGWFTFYFLSFRFFKKFSSPSGVGLVQDYEVKINSVSKIFVPEWGWVGSRTRNIIQLRRIFSSPLGDGLVRVWPYKTVGLPHIFVPAWGWVGSKKKRSF